MMPGCRSIWHTMDGKRAYAQERKTSLHQPPRPREKSVARALGTFCSSLERPESVCIKTLLFTIFCKSNTDRRRARCEVRSWWRKMSPTRIGNKRVAVKNRLVGVFMGSSACGVLSCRVEMPFHLGSLALVVQKVARCRRRRCKMLCFLFRPCYWLILEQCVKFMVKRWLIVSR